MIGIVSEGLTDYFVLKSIIIGFKNDRNIRIKQLKPDNIQPFGYGNLLHYLKSNDFAVHLDNVDHLVIQIDTDKSNDWKPTNIKNIGDNKVQASEFIFQIISTLKNHINIDLINNNSSKIIFAICVHEIECWLLCEHGLNNKEKSKILNCYNCLKNNLNRKSIDISKKNYSEGRNYAKISEPFKKHQKLMAASKHNESLKYFISTELTKLYNINKMN